MGNTCTIHFLGAAGTVTGSKYLLEFPDRNILVDCGMFQGVKKLRELNWQYLPIDVKAIDLVLLTHGHMDHTGFLPRLRTMGYGGPVWGTTPTLDIAEIILRDSAQIQEEDAVRANEEGFTRHDPAKPLYTVKDVENILTFFEAKEKDQWYSITDNIKVRFRYNGHILGATFIEMEAYGKRIVFSGDVGRPEDPLLFDPKKPSQADYLLMESTYGDRRHPIEESTKLQQIINSTIKKDGTLIIPSFAVERAQLLMYLLWQLRSKHAIPRVPVILDSPMGANVLRLFSRHPDWHRLSPEACKAMTESVRIVQSFSETWDIIDDKNPKIIIAGSGMVGGGRVLTYLQQYIDREETTIMLAGFQAEGTRGRQLLEGTKEIKFFGKYYPVKARVEYLQSLSAHADQKELINWLDDMEASPERLFIVHGEPQAADMMRLKLKDIKGWESEIPSLYDISELQL